MLTTTEACADLHERDRVFLRWIRAKNTSRGSLVVARERAMREWQFVAIQRELDRREGKAKCFAPMELAAHARR